MAKHKPIRLCIGCRIRENTENLVRIAFAVTGDSRSLVFDEGSVLPGRGAWIHRDPECFSVALHKRAFARAFRGQVDTQQLEHIAHLWPMKDTNIPNHDESGSEI